MMQKPLNDVRHRFSEQAVQYRGAREWTPGEHQNLDPAYPLVFTLCSLPIK